MIRVVKCLIKNEKGEVLLIKRTKTDIHGGKWETPSGRVDGDESLVAAAARETKKEVGISIAFNLEQKMLLTDESGKAMEVFMLNADEAVDSYEVDMSDNPNYSDYYWLDPQHLGEFLRSDKEIDRWTLTQILASKENALVS